tara:strand:+ start:211 stop:951 length:741 start_codon:yes stop_codon:yes gene_type:complete
MHTEKTQSDYSSTLMRYRPGQGWSPIDYTEAHEDGATRHIDADVDVDTAQAGQTAHTTEHRVQDKHIVQPPKANVIPINITPFTKSPTLAAAITPAPARAQAHTQSKPAPNLQATLGSWVEQASQSPDGFGLQDVEGASLATLGQRLPELFAPLDQYREEAGSLSWVDVANGITEMQHMVQERDQYAELLAQTEASIAAHKNNLYMQLQDIQRQESVRAAAAQLRDRMSAHTAQQVTKRLQHFLDQ